MFYTHTEVTSIGLPVVVQIIILPVKFTAVDHCATFGLTAYLVRRPASGFVIVQVGQDRRMRRDGRHCFGEVRHGVEHDSVGAGTTFPAHRHIREIIHESLEHGYRIAAGSERGYGLGRGADLEAAVAQLPATAVIAETDGKVNAVATGFIINLPAITESYLRGYFPAFQVIQQPGIAQGPDALYLDGGRLGREFFGGIGRDVNTARPFEATECCGEIAVLQGNDQVDDTAPAPQPVVVSQVMDVVDAEARRTFFTQWGEIHTPTRVLLARGDAPAA